MQIDLRKGRFLIIDDVDAGLVACDKWRVNTDGYAIRYKPLLKKGRTRELEYVHRRILGDPPPSMVVDHINGDRLDNRRENLRFCTFSQNAANRRRNTKSTSGYKGVSWSGRHQRWQANIIYLGRSKFLGRYRTPDEAHEVYCLAADMLFGEFSNHG